MTFLINIDKMLNNGYIVKLTHTGYDGKVISVSRVVTDKRNVRDVARYMATVIAKEVEKMQ
jgi:hypothetical protein